MSRVKNVIKLNLCVSILLLGASCFDEIPKVRFSNPSQIAGGEEFVIATAGEASSKAGALMFKKGGTIVDAAVAVSFAISVERPQSTGIGGGGFMLFHDAKNKKTFAIDFRERAPLKADKNLFVDKDDNVIPNKSTEGIFSAAVPGVVAGLVEVHQKYGKLKLKEVMAPSINLARNGFPIYDHLADAIDNKKELLKRFPASASIFLNKDGSTKKSGDILVQTDLAKTLELISKLGKEGFYKGRVARALIAEEVRLGGLITQKDLDNYKVAWREPVTGTYLGHKIESMPPPSSGGIHVIEILNILEAKNIKGDPYSAENIHKTAAAMQLAFADRAKFLGDSDFVSIPIAGLTDKSYAKTLAANIQSKAKSSDEVNHGVPPGYESDQTTHFSIMDKEGNVITSTQTINGWLGSGVVVPGTGVILNNEMDDFATSVGASNMYGAIGGNKNLIEPGKRPLSSMSPTIVFDKHNNALFALGSPSGTRIITCVTLVIQNSLGYKLSLKDSVAALRYHHQWKPDEIFVDTPYFNSKLKQALTAKGYKVTNKDLRCDIQLVGRNADLLQAVSDPRGIGVAVGE